MTIFDLLNVDPIETKIHLAVFNGIDNPLDVYFDDSFKEWQEHQSRKNFQRKYICSLIELPGDYLWLFGGIYESNDIKKSEKSGYVYETNLTSIGEDFRGRLIIQYKRPSRNSYLNGETIERLALVYEVKPEPLSFSEFESFKEVQLTRNQLELLFRHNYPSWRSALSAVSGVYLISDNSSGKLYVGSASGQGGVWSRWGNYANNYHGGNTEFKKLLKEKGDEGFNSFTYSILETCDIDFPEDKVILIENRWKNRLLTRNFGFNKN